MPSVYRAYMSSISGDPITTNGKAIQYGHLVQKSNGRNRKEFINQKTTYCDWSDMTAMHPKTYTAITKEIINTAHKQQTFFIRKIANNCNLCQYLCFILQLKDNQI